MTFMAQSAAYMLGTGSPGLEGSPEQPPISDQGYHRCTQEARAGEVEAESLNQGGLDSFPQLHALSEDGPAPVDQPGTAATRGALIPLENQISSSVTMCFSAWSLSL